MQESLQDNPVFIAFSNDEKLFAEAAQGGWVLAFPIRQCIPKDEQKRLLKRGPSSKKPILQAHLLKPMEDVDPQIVSGHQRPQHSMQVFQALNQDTVILYSRTGSSTSSSASTSSDAHTLVN